VEVVVEGVVEEEEEGLLKRSMPIALSSLIIRLVSAFLGTMYPSYLCLIYKTHPQRDDIRSGM
jgi:hypothetical protein